MCILKCEADRLRGGNVTEMRFRIIDAYLLYDGPMLPFFVLLKQLEVALFRCKACGACGSGVQYVI